LERKKGNILITPEWIDVCCIDKARLKKLLDSIIEANKDDEDSVKGYGFASVSETSAYIKKEMGL